MAWYAVAAARGPPVDAQQPAPRPQVAVLGGINGAGKTSSADPILRVGMRIPCS
jgi:signal recognition particle GTPase